MPLALLVSRERLDPSDLAEPLALMACEAPREMLVPPVPLEPLDLLEGLVPLALLALLA